MYLYLPSTKKKEKLARPYLGPPNTVTGSGGLGSGAIASLTEAADILTSTVHAVNDPFFANVVLLMGFEGVNGSTGAPGLTDESSAAHGTATLSFGGAAISNGYAKFGSTSLGTVNSCYSFPDHADWDFGSGPYTVEMSIKPTIINAANMFLLGQWNFAVGNQSWLLYLAATTGRLSMITSANGIATGYNISGTTNILLDPHTVAVDFDGTKTRVYLDGVMEASTTTFVTLFNSASRLGIGNSAASNAGSYFGFIDELRITKGVARYANDSGYTVATAAFPRF